MICSWKGIYPDLFYNRCERNVKEEKYYIREQLRWDMMKKREKLGVTVAQCPFH